jgi:hypothetical protein
MKVLVGGHQYELANFEQNLAELNQHLQFIHKEPACRDGGTDLKTVADGTTNEEVLAVLIDRMTFLQAKHPCRENAIVITKLEECLMWLNKRTADRQARKVEGTNAK